MKTLFFPFMLCSAALLLSLLALPAPARAEDDDVQGQLSATMQDLKSETAKKEKISGSAKKLKAELASLQKDLVNITARMQKSEKSLLESEARLTALEAEAKEKQAARELRQQQLATMVQTLVHLSRTPTAAVIAMPGDYATTLKTARILGSTSDAVREQAEQLRIKLEEIAQLQKQINTERESAVTERQKLEKERNGLTAKLAERNTLQGQLFTDERKANERVAQLSRQSASLKELLATIETQRANRPKMAEAKPAGGKLRPITQGKMRLPASGKIVSGYGDENSSGDSEKGLTLRTTPNASVVAPYDGQVVFTGPFLNYGKMVILRHSDGYHSLVAGLARIDCKPGEFLLEGEPIGAMGSKNNLYIELRKNNRPIDPSPWFHS